nr:unnamed protein product [Callosobruchus analis]
MKQNIGRGEFSQFPNLSQTNCQEDDVSTYVQHLNASIQILNPGLRGDLRFTLTKLTANVYSLLLNHQVHPSH